MQLYDNLLTAFFLMYNLSNAMLSFFPRNANETNKMFGMVLFACKIILNLAYSNNISV